MRDKEQLDIADSSALLLHPNQFSITNPSSPGGLQNPRKTRHARHQRDLDDMGNNSLMRDVLDKRRRKAVEDEIDSPAPSGRVGDASSSTPLRDARSKMVYSQQEAPLYSVERLFTEKELQMSTYQASIAASRYFASLRNQGSQPFARNGTNGDATDGEERPFTAADIGVEDESLVALATDRAANNSAFMRVTRHNALAELASAAELAPPFPSRAIPVAFVNTSSKTPAAAQLPTGVKIADLETDMKIMTRPRTADNDALNARLLAQACKRETGNRMFLESQVGVPEIREELGAVQSLLEPPLAGVPSSMQGISDIGGIGGVIMTRQESGRGKR